MFVQSDSESVTGTDEPVAIDPASLNKPVYPTEDDQLGNAEIERLRHKLGLEKGFHKAESRRASDAEKRAEIAEAELAELKEKQRTAEQSKLEEQGQYKELWEQLSDKYQTDMAAEQQKIAELVTQQKNAELKTAALTQIANANAVNPEQLFTLLQPQLRTSKDGHPVLLSSGVEQSLAEYLSNLKQSPDWQHHFSASRSRGTGSVGSTTTVAPGMSNPFQTGNFTEAMQLEMNNPELYKLLKAEHLRSGK